MACQQNHCHEMKTDQSSKKKHVYQVGLHSLESKVIIRPYCPFQSNITTTGSCFMRTQIIDTSSNFDQHDMIIPDQPPRDQIC